MAKSSKKKIKKQRLIDDLNLLYFINENIEKRLSNMENKIDTNLKKINELDVIISEDIKKRL